MAAATPAPSPQSTVPPRVQAAALQRHRARGAPAWLHEEVARRMAERLSLLRRPPQRILDWGGPAGASEALLRQHAPQAERIALDDQGRPLRGHPTGGWLRRWLPARSPAEAPLAPADLLWSNMQLHWVDDLPARLRQWQAALAVDGLLMFSCFGPDTLRELRSLYAQAGWGAPASDWLDMHDLGDALVQAGFADPVMDMERLTLTWDSPTALLAELRTLGGNTAPQRFAGLRTPRWREALQQALTAGLQGPDGRLRLTFEIVYGHALRPAPRAAMGAETRVSLDAMREMARQRPPR
ncbi:MAG: methyltransferase domain-containing protein [Burkholderiaceae bacterium]|nr:methyltransferase domain-containing protein [Burkholderiaceae bacterium]